MSRKKSFANNTKGYAVVEATILFPIIIMIFAGLVLLSMYLPTRSALQQATQYAANAIATEQSDTWLTHDPDSLKYSWIGSKSQLPNVYVSVLRGLGATGRDDGDNARRIVEAMSKKGPLSASGDLEVTCGVTNFVIYKEISVTATRTIPSPVNLSFVGFPKEIPITVTSKAVVQNGDEFLRNMDLAAEFIDYAAEKYGLKDKFSGLTEGIHKVMDFLGI